MLIINTYKNLEARPASNQAEDHPVTIYQVRNHITLPSTKQVDEHKRQEQVQVQHNNNKFKCIKKRSASLTSSRRPILQSTTPSEKSYHSTIDKASRRAQATPSCASKVQIAQEPSTTKRRQVQATRAVHQQSKEQKCNGKSPAQDKRATRQQVQEQRAKHESGYKSRTSTNVHCQERQAQE